MRPDVKTDWATALRSGKYKKTKHRLHAIDGRRCVNGVLCDLAVKAGVEMEIREFLDLQTGKPQGYSYDAHGAFPPDAVIEWAGIDGKHEHLLNRLARHNDLGATFEELADEVEELF